MARKPTSAAWGGGGVHVGHTNGTNPMLVKNPGMTDEEAREFEAGLRDHVPAASAAPSSELETEATRITNPHVVGDAQRSPAGRVFERSLHCNFDCSHHVIERIRDRDGRPALAFFDVYLVIEQGDTYPYEPDDPPYTWFAVMSPSVPWLPRIVCDGEEGVPPEELLARWVDEYAAAHPELFGDPVGST